MPRPLSHEQMDYRRRWMEWFALCRVDWDAVAHDREEACWYVARYGNQNFDTVTSWTWDKVQRAVGHLGKFITAEAPK